MNKVVVFATDDVGGAGKASLRLVKALNFAGLAAKLVVKNKCTSDDNVVRVHGKSKFKLGRRIKNHIFRSFVKDIKLDPKYYFFGYKDDDIEYKDIVSSINFIPDTIIITWIGNFVSAETVRELSDFYKAKLILYPMDMSLYTGGCHYAWECKGFEGTCSNCPAILSAKHRQVALKRLKEKKMYWRGGSVEFWACSSGVFNEIQRSSILRNGKLRMVYIPIDSASFSYRDKEGIRASFGINEEDKVILFGSAFSFEHRKGINLFLEAMKLMHSQYVGDKDCIKIIIAGRKQEDMEAYPLPFNVIDIDFIAEDYRLADLYLASDVLVVPSIQDSGPMMINEAQMCGTPVVAFNIGVASDFIINGETGYVCETGSVQELSEGVMNVLMGKLELDGQSISNLALNKSSFTAFANLLN